MNELEQTRLVAGVLAALLVLAWGSRCYWKGVATKQEDSGWADEADWWRKREIENRAQRVKEPSDA